MPPKLLSIRQYALKRGVSHTAVNKAVKAGKIPMTNGRIDPELADAAWERNRDSRQASKLAGDPPAPAGTLKMPAAAAAAAVESPRPAGRQLGPAPGSLAYAQLIIATVKAKRVTKELQAFEGTQISADEVRAAQIERATAEREALLNWPSRIAADLAAKFNVNEREMFLALDAEVRRFLEGRSQQPLESSAA